MYYYDLLHPYYDRVLGTGLRIISFGLWAEEHAASSLPGLGLGLGLYRGRGRIRVRVRVRVRVWV